MTIKVVIVEPSVAGNIGATARVMKNFGFNDLVLINPQTEFTSQTYQFALKASDILESAKIYSSLEEFKKTVSFLVGTTAKIIKDQGSTDARVAVNTTDPSLINILSTKGDIGLVFGREDIGLLNKEINLCDMTIHIPTAKEYKALNLAQAVAIILYSLHKLTLKGKITDYREANRDEKEILIELFSKNVSVLGYNKNKEKHLIRRFRNIIGRAFISGKEATSLCGVFSRSFNKIVELEKKLE